MGENRKKFKLTTAILAVICVVFVAEAAAPWRPSEIHSISGGFL